MKKVLVLVLKVLFGSSLIKAEELANGRPVSIPSTMSWVTGQEGSNLVDGDLDTYAQLAGVTNSEQPWINIELANLKRIRAVMVEINSL